MQKRPIPTTDELRKKLEDMANTGKPICVQCGILLRGEYHYCPNCGNGRAELFDKPSAKFAFICIICGQEIKDIFAKYCPNCGQNIRRQIESIKKKDSDIKNLKKHVEDFNKKNANGTK